MRHCMRFGIAAVTLTAAAMGADRAALTARSWMQLASLSSTQRSWFITPVREAL